jgi:hypothetical protein
LLALSVAERAALIEDFNRTFAEGAQLVAGRGELILCAFDAPETLPPPSATDPQTVLGEDIGAHLPQGRAGAPLRALMSEIEIWLHDHALNEARQERGAAPINGLWLWGGARAHETAPAVELWSHGEDPLFGAYEPRARYSSDARSGVVACSTVPGETGFAAFEREWLAPALSDLRAGRLEALELSIGPSSHRLGRFGSYRVWRTAQPWWNGLGGDDNDGHDRSGGGTE